MLNEKQKKAIEKLEKAFAECEKQDISFYGYDTDFYWSLVTEQEMEECAREWLNEAMDEDNAGRVETGLAYKGSGGM
jgi:hypothetical protein